MRRVGERVWDRRVREGEEEWEGESGEGKNGGRRVGRREWGRKEWGRKRVWEGENGEKGKLSFTCEIITNL